MAATKRTGPTKAWIDDKLDQIERLRVATRKRGTIEAALYYLDARETFYKRVPAARKVRLHALHPDKLGRPQGAAEAAEYNWLAALTQKAPRDAVTKRTQSRLRKTFAAALLDAAKPVTPEPEAVTPDWRRQAADAIKQGERDSRKARASRREEIEAAKAIVHSFFTRQAAAAHRAVDAATEDDALSRAVNLIRYGEARDYASDERFWHVPPYWRVTTQADGSVEVTHWWQSRRGARPSPSLPGQHFTDRAALRRRLEAESYLKCGPAPHGYLPDRADIEALIDGATPREGAFIGVSSGLPHDEPYPRGTLLLMDSDSNVLRTLTLAEAWALVVEVAPPEEPVTALEMRYIAPDPWLDADADAARRVRERTHDEKVRTCAACGATFRYSRIDQRVCSGKCRVRLHRQQRAAK